MTTYEVYYRKNETFRPDKSLKMSDITNMKTHVAVALIEGSKDDVFRKMQGEFMDAGTSRIVNGMIKKGHTHHTSMSVGDVLRDFDTGATYQCDMVGWTKVGGK